jgi:WD40 repeat protein
MFVQVQFVFLSISLLANDPEQSSGILKERTVLKGHSMRVSCVAFSPDGTKLATACRVASGARAGERGPELRLWDVATGKECAVEKCSQPYDFEFLAFSPDGKVLANSTGTLWDIVKDKERVTLRERTTLKINLGDHARLAFSADGKRLGAADRQIAKVWDLDKEREISSVTITGGQITAFSPDLRTVASKWHQDVDLWDTATGKLRKSFLDHRGLVEGLAFSADGKTLVVGSSGGDGDGNAFGEIRSWDIGEDKQRATVDKISTGQGFLLALSSDAKIVVLLESEYLPVPKCKLKVLDMATGKALGTFSFKKRNDVPSHVAISSDGRTLVTDCQDGALKLWEIVLP